MKRLFTILLTFCFLHSASAQLEFLINADQSNVGVGDTLTIEVQTQNFTNIFGYLVDFQFDGEAFELVEDSVNPDRYDNTGIFTSNVLTNGNIRLLVSASDPFTFANGKVLWTIQFVAIQEKASTSFSLVDCGGSCDYSFSQDGVTLSGPNVSAVNNGTLVEVGEGGGGGTTTPRARFYKTNAQATRNENVCIDVKVEDMPPFLGLEGSFSWDKDSLEYTGVENFNSNIPGLRSSNFGGANSEGRLAFTYALTSSTEEIELSADETLFSICFVAKGEGEVNFDNTNDFGPTWAIFASEEVDIPRPTLDNTAGNIEIFEPTPGAPSLTIGEVTTSPNQEICVPVTFDNIDDIEAFSFNIQYDANAFTVKEPVYAIPEDQLFDFRTNTRQNEDEGISTFLYFGDAVSFPNGTKLMDICFEAIGDPGIYNLTYSEETNLDNEFTKGGVIIAGNFIPGSITISGSPLSIDESNSSQTNVSCNGGADGSAQLAATGGNSSNYSYDWAHVGGNSNNQQVDGLTAGQYSVTITDGSTQVSRTFTITEPSNLEYSLQTSNPTAGASNGTLRVNPSGGTGPYTYLWNTGETTQEITNLGAGTYQFTITDANNCTLADEGILNGPLAVSGVPTDPTCFNGSNGAATVNVVGGQAPYMFNWSNGMTTRMISGLSAGQYTVTVTDANDQTNTNTVTLLSPTEILASASTTDATDQDPNSGSVTLTVTGGTPNYIFRWSNGAATRDLTDVQAGVYAVTITDANNCEQVVSGINVNETRVNQTRIVNVAVFDELDCAGDADAKARVTVTPADGDFTFTWSGLPDGSNTTTTREVSGLSGGTQTVTVVNNSTNEEVVETFDVLEPAPLSVSFSDLTAPSQVGVNDGSANLSVMGGTSPYDVTWNSDCDGQGVFSCDFLRANENQILVVDANGCRVTPSFIIPQPSNANCDDHRPVITPNGDGKNETLEFFCDITSNNVLEIYDRWGVQVFQQENYDNLWEGTDVSGSKLAPGAYFYVFRVTSASGVTTQYKGHVTLLREF